ncbi:YaaR family protein [Salicibibacter cibarius]|uniref:YaaR family protein n=1 Tax=Salicibibacter cibarius TaxID=2743000 RepID=A0A7T7CBF9_9BACI|nr:YaaR family protein [Salicibibacter cibarius]QQK75944.1 YaaR family protein [Salicibibacter cibarius]
MDIEHLGKTETSSRMMRRSMTAPSNQGLRSQSFQDIMNHQRQSVNADRLQAAMNTIEDQGKMLAEFRTAKELREYKKLIRNFMDDVVRNGLQIEDRRSFNRRGTNACRIVTEVDEKLMRLTEDMIENEAVHLDILAHVDEIRGLLLNLYR